MWVNEKVLSDRTLPPEEDFGITLSNSWDVKKCRA